MAEMDHLLPGLTAPMVLLHLLHLRATNLVLPHHRLMVIKLFNLAA